MSSIQILIMSYSVLIPAAISWVRFKKIHPTFYPFVFFIWLGLLNEMLSTLLIKVFQQGNTINSNIYVLLEGLLLLWQFERWGNFENKRGYFYFYITVFLSVWLVENFYISRITSVASYFRILYSAIICLMSINYINFVMVRERRSLFLNSSFLICAALIVYFTYKAMIEVFWLYGLNNGKPFRIRVYEIFDYINLLANCIFALAVTCIPFKQRFTLPSS